MSLIAGNLGVVQRLLDADQFVWAVCAGAAAHLYGQRRPIQDVDVLVTQGKLAEVVRLLQSQNKVVQFDGQRILWRGIKFFDDLTIRRPPLTYPFVFDDAMRTRLRRISLLGSLVPVLPPEDVLVHKLILNRGAEQGKHDLPDAAGIVRRQQLDLEYLRLRLQTMRANGIADAALADLGIVLA
jgi:hypothetical protein